MSRYSWCCEGSCDHTIERFVLCYKCLSFSPVLYRLKYFRRVFDLSTFSTPPLTLPADQWKPRHGVNTPSFDLTAHRHLHRNIIDDSQHFFSPGNRRPEGLRVHLVLPNSSLVTKHHRIQEVQHVQVSYVAAASCLLSQQ